MSGEGKRRQLWSLPGTGIRLTAMNDLKDYKMNPASLLTMATNVLHKAMVEVSRTTSKNIFNVIADGKRATLLHVMMEDDVEVRFEVSLDHSEYQGEKLNFARFHNSLVRLVDALSKSLRDGGSVPVFDAQSDNSLMIGVPAVTQEGDAVNVLMMIIDFRVTGGILLKLKYFEHSEFEPTSELAIN